MEQQTKKTSALYCRTATVDMRAIQSQIERLCQFAAMNEFAYKVYADNGCSGTSFDRPAFQQMLRDVEAGQIDRIIAVKFDRYGRNTFETISLLKEQIKQNGVEVFTVFEGNLTASINNRSFHYSELTHQNRDAHTR